MALGRASVQPLCGVGTAAGQPWVVLLLGGGEPQARSCLHWVTGKGLFLHMKRFHSVSLWCAVFTHTCWKTCIPSPAVFLALYHHLSYCSRNYINSAEPTGRGKLVSTDCRNDSGETSWTGGCCDLLLLCSGRTFAKPFYLSMSLLSCPSCSLFRQ